MYSLIPVATLALSAISSVSGLVVPRISPPNGWRADILEFYGDYHSRYMALDCLSKHNTEFFDQCCHPLLKTQSLSDRPAQCTPSASASSSASAVDATSTADPDDEECDDDDDEDTPPPPPPTTPVTHTTAVQPPPTTPAVKPAKPASTTHHATTTTAAKPQDTPKSSPANTQGDSSALNSGGFATFFYQNGVAGACGAVHSDNDFIAAIDGDRYGNLGAHSGLCGKKVRLTNSKNGKSVTVTIEDACPTCKNGNSIDLSVAAFKQIATLDEGEVPIQWSFS